MIENKLIRILPMKHLLLILFCSSNLVAIAADELPGFKKEPDFTKKLIKTVYSDQLNNKGFSPVYDYDVPATFIPFMPINPEASSDCTQKSESAVGPGFIRNVKNFETPVFKLQCDFVKELSKKREYTVERCAGIANCLKSKLDYQSPEARMILMKAREEVAKETIAMTAKKTFVDMIEFEELRKFSTVKYGENFLPKSCMNFNVLSITSNRKDQCRSIIEKGFELSQRVCKIPESDCQRDYLSYLEKNKVSSNESLVSSYIENKTEKTMSDVFIKDYGILNKVALVLSDSSLTPEARVEATFNFLGDNYQDLDPVFKDYYNRSYKDKSTNKQDLIRDSLLSYVKINEKKSSVDIMADLEDLRKSEAKKMLEGQCGNITRMDDLCNVTYDVMAGVEVHIDKEEFYKVISRQEDGFPNTVSNDEIAKSIGRCNTFVLTSMKGSFALSEERLSNGYDLFSSESSGALKKDTLDGSAEGHSKIVIGPKGVSKTNALTPILTNELAKKEHSKDKSTELVLVQNFSKNVKLPEVYDKERDGVNNSSLKQLVKKENIEGLVTNRETADQVKNSSTQTPATDVVAQPRTNTSSGAGISVGAKGSITNPSIPKEYFDNNFPVADSRIDTTSVKPQGSTNDYQQLLSKISELEGRLAKSQKSQPDQSKKELTGPSVSNNEEESSLIKELNSAKSELAEINKRRMADFTPETPKNKNRKITQRNSEEEDDEESEEDEESSLSTGTSGSRTSGSSRTIASSAASSAPSAQSNAERVATSSGADSSPGISGQSLTPRSNEDETSTASTERPSVDSVVLLKVEGSASRDKLHELIYAESGKKFYIEEEGMIKEIIPTVVDGKILLNKEGAPIYQIVLKGKAKDFKLDKKSLAKKSLKIESPADLKKNDNDILRASPAIRYRELQNVLYNKTKTAGQ